eukprot:CAMPEP_0118715632 /NCGR_PEP_ID=MMETSP0800-20121206/27008_1 /TAXON_ID=210618 ORGANISM="Striatella unipunctata, Strain CCMP2910" /NCGR_SAMPLE_ID=MMETSP0800 /ASSEMBLY_ACC=CAM_ASM_000638 /LENGTH=329 /DNA_ID=CAMNT_0006621873 /DNA_START=154 /DNA_END=1143 /DNA_ORIENTATION=-
MKISSCVIGFLIVACSSTTTTAFVPARARTSIVPSLVGKTSRTAPPAQVPPLVIVSAENKEASFDVASGKLKPNGEEEEEEEDCVSEDEYCAVDKKTGKLIRLTVEEKERIFLDALQSYYFSGRTMLGDAEFDLLKEDLSWNGSKVIDMNRDEAKYMAAMEAYVSGKPILSDEEFDELKQKLKSEKSKFAVSTEPKCYIDTGICTVTLRKDNFRNNLLYLPATIAATIVWLGLADVLIEPIIRLNPILLLALGGYPIYNVAKYVTENFLFQKGLIAYGPCPSCEFENRIYFGDILGLPGFSDVASTRCTKCKTQFKVQQETLRASTLPK